MEQHLHLENHHQKELVIRQGSALPLVQPKNYSFEGAFTAPSSFLETRPDFFKDKKESCVVEVNRNAREILFNWDFDKDCGGYVKGTLIQHPNLSIFHINDDNTKYTIDQIRKLVKVSKHLFDTNIGEGGDPVPGTATHQGLLMKLSSFQAMSSTKVEDNEYKKGKLSKSVEVNTIHNDADTLPSFFIKVPLFVGYDPVRIMVDIEMFVHSTGETEFWFQSDELYGITEEFVEKQFKEELLHFVDFGCPILER